MLYEIPFVLVSFVIIATTIQWCTTTKMLQILYIVYDQQRSSNNTEAEVLHIIAGSNKRLIHKLTKER